MEQTPEAISRSRTFCELYGVAFETPVSDYQSLDEVKYQLLDFGVTTKSLEAVSLFADTFSLATTDSILAYIESKLPICRDYIRLKAQTPT
jgi:trans-2-enoyl-CoA reductase